MILIVDEPTRGVDVGAKADVHDLLYQVSRSGAAVVVISSDLPEILDVSDRVYVMREGTISGELTRRDATEEAVMRFASLAMRWPIPDSFASSIIWAAIPRQRICPE